MNMFQSVVKSANQISAGGGLALFGVGFGIGGFYLGSSIDSATQHSNRLLVEFDKWGSRLDRVTTDENIKGLNTAAQGAINTFLDAGKEAKKQSDLWRAESLKLREATDHVVAHSELLLLQEHRRLTGSSSSSSSSSSSTSRGGGLPAASPLATAVHPKLVSELALVAAGMENPDHLRQLTTLARTLNARA
jgi:hypothetical protein